MTTKRFVILFLLLSAWLEAQTVINGGRTVIVSWDASSVASTRPFKTGSILPGACATGEVFSSTSAAAGQNLVANPTMCGRR